MGHRSRPWGHRSALPGATIAPRLGQVTAFDGVRGVSVMMVIALHAAPLKLESWSSALDVFFVLSGFLITTLLLEEADRTGTISLRRFYTRRAWRLLPSLYTLLAIVLVLSVIAAFVNSEVDLGLIIRQDIVPAGLYYYNFANPLGYPSEGVLLFQMWSLSLEEQFYIVGALIVLLMVRTRRFVAGAVVLTAIAILIEIARGRGDLGPLNFWLQRPDALLMGVVGALVSSRIPADLSDRTRRWMRGAGWAALGVMLLTWSLSMESVRKLNWFFVPYTPDPPEGLSDQAVFRFVLDELPNGNYWVRWGYTVTIWTTVILVIVLAREQRWPVARALSVRPLRLLGRMSYVLYLFHTLPLWLIVFPMAPNLPTRIVLAWALSLAISAPVYLAIEKHALRRKARHSSTADIEDGAPIR
jgi:peptidoglycan/LPS O-acetylase OafA/YrhL